MTLVPPEKKKKKPTWIESGGRVVTGGKISVYYPKRGNECKASKNK